MSKLNEKQRKTKTEDLFTTCVDVHDLTGCWNWKGRITAFGYGHVKRVYKGKKYGMAHRLAYAVLVGEIPDGLTVDHLCRNRACVNPAHMEIVTLAENNRRRGPTPASFKPQVKTTCPRGHEYDKVYRGKKGGTRLACSLCCRERMRIIWRMKHWGTTDVAAARHPRRTLKS